MPPANNNFVTDNSFSSVFGNQDSKSGEYLIRPLSLFYEIQISLLSHSCQIKCTVSFLSFFLFFPLSSHSHHVRVYIHFGERFLASDFVSYFCILLNSLDSLATPVQVNPKKEKKEKKTVPLN